jgi:hypothetical protein
MRTRVDDKSIMVVDGDGGGGGGGGGVVIDRVEIGRICDCIYGI